MFFFKLFSIYILKFLLFYYCFHSLSFSLSLLPYFYCCWVKSRNNRIMTMMMMMMMNEHMKIGWFEMILNFPISTSISKFDLFKFIQNLNHTNNNCKTMNKKNYKSKIKIFFYYYFFSLFLLITITIRFTCFRKMINKRTCNNRMKLMK